MAIIDKLFLRNDYRSPEEQQFCEAWARKEDREVAQLTAYIGFVLHPFIVLLIQPIVLDHYQSEIYWTHAFQWLFSVSGVALARFGRDIRLVSFLAWNTFVLSYAYTLYIHVAHIAMVPDAHGSTVLFAMTVTGIAIIEIRLLPYRDYRKTLSILLALIAFSIAMYEHSVFGPWVVCFASFVLTALIMWKVRAFRDERVVQLEFRRRTKVLPVKYVLASALSGEEAAAVFPPEARYCVCISSDWRGYQELSSQMHSRDLAESLSAYYDLCKGLLTDLFPDRAYHLDWIADELFVVLYGETGESEKQLVDRGLEFSLSLLEAKQAFMRQHGLPRSVDIGIASGMAHVGMMGPEGAMKATALGEIPGRARRLQAAGKVLRDKVGSQDRIVFGADALKKIARGFEVHSFVPDRPLRDLDDREIFYMEPITQADATEAS